MKAGEHVRTVLNNRKRQLPGDDIAPPVSSLSTFYLSVCMLKGYCSLCVHVSVCVCVSQCVCVYHLLHTSFTS